MHIRVKSLVVFATANTRCRVCHFSTWSGVATHMPRHTSFRHDSLATLLNNAPYMPWVCHLHNVFDISWMNSFFVMHDSLHVIYYSASLVTLQWQQLMIAGDNDLWQVQFEYMHLYISFTWELISHLFLFYWKHCIIFIINKLYKSRTKQSPFQSHLVLGFVDEYMKSQQGHMQLGTQTFCQIQKCKYIHRMENINCPM